MPDGPHRLTVFGRPLQNSGLKTTATTMLSERRTSHRHGGSLTYALTRSEAVRGRYAHSVPLPFAKTLRSSPNQNNPRCFGVLLDLPAYTW